MDTTLHLRLVEVQMTIVTPPDIQSDDYVVVGLASCFFRDDEGLQEVSIVEPIPSAALAALLKGIPTSYKSAYATTIGELLSVEGGCIPAGFPAEAKLGEGFVDRTFAAARTYQKQPAAKDEIPLGTTYQDFQYSVERKRVLNARRTVTKADNVKQHAYTHQKL
jgi:hypothetical protein